MNKKFDQASTESATSTKEGSRHSFALQIQQLKESFEQNLDQQLESLAAEVEARSAMEAKIADLSASETKLREELESALDRAAEQKLQVKRMSKEKGLDRAAAQDRYEKLERSTRLEIEGLKNKLAIAIQEKEEFSEFFQYTEKTLKEKLATLETEKSMALREAESAKSSVSKFEGELERERSLNRKLENSIGSDQGRIETYEIQLEEARAQFAQQENESRRKLAFIADEKWGLELQVAQLTKDIEIQKVRLASMDDSQARLRSLEQELKATTERKPDFTAFNEVRAQFNDEFNRVKTERANLEVRYNAAQEEMGTLRSQILKAQAELEKTQIASEKAMAAFKVEAEVRLSTSLESERNAQQKRLQERETEFSAEIREMRRELADANTRTSTLNGQLEAARERLVHFAEIEQESCAEIVRLTDLIEKERSENKIIAAERIQIEYALKKEVDIAQARLTQVESRLQTTIEALNQSDVQVSQLRDSNRILGDEKAKFEAHTLRLTQELARAETSAWDFEENLEKAVNDREKYRLGEAKTKIDLAQAESDLNRANHDLQRLRTAHEAAIEVFEATKLERDKAKETSSVYNEQRAHFETQLKFEKAQAEADHQRLSADLARVQSSLDRAEQSIEKLKTERDQLQEALVAATEGKTALEANSTLSNSQAQARIRRLTEDLAKAEASIIDGEDQIEKLLKDRETAHSKANALTGEQQQANLQIERLKEEISRLKNMKTENETLRAEQSAYSDANSRLRLQENQLRHYASSLGKEKAEIAKLGQGLLEEIRLLSKTHPLKDYLSATEFEISKVGIQLKTTPTIAPERTAIEINLTKLTEQRDFLRSVLNGSQKHFERQMADVQALIEKTTALVPPPPSVSTVKAVAENAGAAAPLQAESPAKDVNWERPLDQIV